MKYSKQREVIYAAMQSSLWHPTADDVYSHVRAELPNISLGTVYRNLNLLVQQGELRKISTPTNGDRFDATLTPHYHMVCSSCGKITDVEGDIFENACNKLENDYDFKVTDKHIIISGICSNCNDECAKSIS